MALGDPNGELPLVADRTCGYCVVCCYAPYIDVPELTKPPGVTCAHCTGRGCGIYEARPRVCRGFFCGWRLLQDLDDDWRPDKSGVLIMARRNNVPERYGESPAWDFLVTGGEAAIRRADFAAKFLLLVARDTPVFLSLVGRPGFNIASAFMNDVLADVARKGDFNATMEILLRAYRELAKADVAEWQSSAPRPETEASERAGRR